MSKYGHRPHNWFEAIVNKLGGEEAAERFLRDELSVSDSNRLWYVEDSVVYFSVTSDGTTGEGWVARLEDKGFRVSDDIKEILHSQYFNPTCGVKTDVAVLKGVLFDNKVRNAKGIHVEANNRKLLIPNAEIACLIRLKFSNEEIKAMGLLGITVMHEPIKDPFGNPYLLGSRRDRDDRLFYRCLTRYNTGHDRDCGFAFVVSQTKVSS